MAAAANTVEATLRSRFDDGVTAGIEHTGKALGQALTHARQMSSAMGAGVTAAITGALGALENLRQRLNRASSESESSFGKMSLSAAAMSVAVVAGAMKAAQAVASFVFGVVKEASEVTELKLSFEALTAAQGENADVLLGKLKQATEGQIATTMLLRNANRVLSSEIPVTTDVYSRLVGNVYSLAKAAGADTSQAVNTLTDALIRGNARGFQTVGIAINVKDAVSEMAHAMGVGSAQVASGAKLQAFYNELLEKTEKAVAKLPPQFISVEDALNRVSYTWREYLLQFGEAVGRSRVLQELLQRVNEQLFNVTASKERVDHLTVAVNEFFLRLLNGLAFSAEAMGVFSTGWDAIWGTIKTVLGFAAAAVLSALYLIQLSVVETLDMLSRLPNPFGASMKKWATDARAALDSLGRGARGSLDVFFNAFSGFDENRQKLNTWADASRKLAADLAQFRNEVIQGTAATGKKTDADEGAAKAMEKLNEQLQKYRELSRELFLRTASPEQRALIQLMKDVDEIGKLTLLRSDQRRQLELQALRTYNAAIAEIGRKRADEERQAQQQADDAMAQHLQSRENIARAIEVIEHATGESARRREEEWTRLVDQLAKEREERRQKEAARTIAAATAIERAIELAQQGKISRSVGTQALGQLPAMISQVRREIAELERMQVLDPAQLEDLFNLYESLERLNRLDLSPFEQHLLRLKQNLQETAGTVTNAWGSFWADMVSGQENAGKKFLAALLNMIAGELMLWAVEETALAIRAAAMLDFAGAARHAAAAVALGALGGVIKGYASALAQTNRAGAGGSFQQDVPRPTSSTQVPVYMVGSPRGAQTPGQAAEPVSGEIRLRIEPTSDFVVRKVEENVRSNGRLRVVIQNA